MTDEPPRKRMVRKPTGGEDTPRGGRKKVEPTKVRSQSSRSWIERQLNDPFVAESRALGYRSRAALKLREIDERFGLIRRGARVLDLGCAPGGWLQYALQKGAAVVAGVDLLPLEPVDGAIILQGDFTEPGCGERLIAALGGQPDVILSDMAPNTIGHKQTDHLRIMGLIEIAVDFAEQVLPPGGSFLVKAFQGGETAEIIAGLKKRFAQVRHLKPKASRPESSEVYILASGFKGL